MVLQSSPLEILVATRNPGKIRELNRALSLLPLKLRYLDEFPDVSVIEEVGQTYEENALLKALGYSKQIGICAIADDSGLEVDALKGKPGVFSARFGGEHVSDQERIERLLAAISEYADRKRSARFICCMALAGWAPGEEPTMSEPHVLTITEAKCEGHIAASPQGTHGFGFDPVFVPEGYNRTFAELADEVKGAISHRALALAAMGDFLDRWLTQT